MAVPTTTSADALSVEAERKGDLVYHVVDTVKQTGLSQTFASTPSYAWLMLLLTTLLGVLAAKMAVRIHRQAAVNAIAKGRMVRAILLNATAGPVGLFFVELGLGTGLTFIRITPGQRLWLIAAFQFLNVVLVGWLLYNLVDLVALMLTRWSRGRQGRLSAMLVPLVRKVLRTALVCVLGLFAAQNIFGADIGALLAGLGLVGLAVSLGAQDTLKHLFGSVTLFTDAPFAIGDAVRVDAFEGVVEDIGFRSTRIRTPDGYVVSIPNGTVANAAIVNQSRRPAIRRVVELALPVATTSVAELRKALTILRDVLADGSVADAIDAGREPPRVFFDQLGTDAHRIRMIYRFRGHDQAAYLAHAERVNLAIIERLGAAGIAFANVDAPPR